MGYSEYVLNILHSGQVPEKEPGYIVYTREKTIVRRSTLPEDAVLVTAQDVEALLYQDCLTRLEQFVRSDHNRDVFALTLYIDTEGGYHGLSMNTERDFRARVQEKYSEYSEEQLTGLHGVRYNEGDFGHRFYGKEFLSLPLKEVMNAYYAISADHPITEVSRDIAFENSFFKEQMILCGVNVLKRLEAPLKALDVTDDFIVFVSLHDVDGEVIKTLMRQTNSLETLKRVFPEHF